MGYWMGYWRGQAPETSMTEGQSGAITGRPTLQAVSPDKIEPPKTHEIRDLQGIY
jgi:hypothetical protein